MNAKKCNLRCNSDLHKSDEYGPSSCTYVFALPELDIKSTVSNKKTVGNAMSHKMIPLGG